MEKQAYETIVIDVVFFGESDVIVTSNSDPTQETFDGEIV